VKASVEGNGEGEGRGDGEAPSQHATSGDATSRVEAVTETVSTAVPASGCVCNWALMTSSDMLCCARSFRSRAFSRKTFRAAVCISTLASTPFNSYSRTRS